jgi:hypothetical protein
MHRTKSASFDHLVGAGLERRRHCEAQLFPFHSLITPYYAHVEGDIDKPFNPTIGLPCSI